MVEQTVQKHEEEIRTLNRIVRGDKDSPEPGGLIYFVGENTKFRQFVHKWLWLMLTIVSGLIVERILNIIGGG